MDPIGVADGSAAAEAAHETLHFAEQLYAERDFYRAITEYKRYLFLQPDTGRAGWVRLRIGQSYLAGRKYVAARAAFSQLREQVPADDLLHLQASLALARSFYLDRRLHQALSVIEPLAKKMKRAGLGSEARYLAGCAHLRAGELGQARQAFAGIWAAHPLAERAGIVLQRLSHGEQLPEKSTVAAGLLSIVPGLGHVYLEQYSVGLTAFAWNGLFGYAAFEAFRHRRWGVGSLLVAMELLWYSGTIYGAVSGAERYNRDGVLNYLDELDQAAGLDLAVPDDRRVTEIVLGGRF